MLLEREARAESENEKKTGQKKYSTAMAMATRLLLNLPRSFFTVAQRLNHSKSNFNLASEMKMFNEKKEFEKVLNLFDEWNEKKDQRSSSMVITQALKACTRMQDLQRGMKIHHSISSDSKEDAFILTSLIHFYSKLTDGLYLRTIALSNSSGMWRDEQSRGSIRSSNNEKRDNVRSDDERLAGSSPR